jgi:methylenetetrahydrofolate dehydrogenase (NADP+)/methenyltetrahydrofolate cyclohydrolase
MNGLLVFFPLSHRVNARRVVNAIIPAKDIDGLGAVSVGRLAAEESTFQLFHDDLHATLTDERRILSVSNFLPCTPFGVIRLLKYSGVTIKGKNAVVIGKSLATGKPLSLMLLAKEATVTTCHRSTHDLAFHLKNADIICSATGVRNLIKGDMISDGAVVVDIGVSVLGDGKIVGDVDFESVSKKASMITPVPGGVGPVTIAMLLENTVRSAQRSELLTV